MAAEAEMKKLNMVLNDYLNKGGETMMADNNDVVKFVSNKKLLEQEVTKEEMPSTTTPENYVRNFAQEVGKNRDTSFIMPFEQMRWRHWSRLLVVEREIDMYNCINWLCPAEYRVMKDNYFQAWVKIAHHPSVGKEKSVKALIDKWRKIRSVENPGKTSMNLQYHKERTELLCYQYYAGWSFHRKWSYLGENNKMRLGYDLYVHQMKMKPLRQRRMKGTHFKLLQQFSCTPNTPIVFAGYADIAENFTKRMRRRMEKIEEDARTIDKVIMKVCMYGKVMRPSRGQDNYYHQIMENPTHTNKKVNMHYYLALALGATEYEAMSHHKIKSSERREKLLWEFKDELHTLYEYDKKINDKLIQKNEPVPFLLSILTSMGINYSIFSN